MAKREIKHSIEDIDEQINQESIPYDYDTKEYPVEVIIHKFDQGQIFVPTYQRQFVWKLNQRARFIESVFLGVPIMPFLVSVSGKDAELEIIDGSQRIRTLAEYCNGRLKLSGLEKLTFLNGTRFSDLSTARQNKFLLRDFRFHVVTENAKPEIRADIFNRVNTSSNKLTSSETRRGAYQYKFYNFVVECSQNELFHEVCPISKSRSDRGEYEELALRFFAYSESYLSFKHDVSSFLDDYVKAHKSSFDEERMRNAFFTMLNFAKKELAPCYFARSERDKSTPRVRFEALAVGIHFALLEKPNLTVKDRNWLNSIEFKKVTTSDASNNPGRLKERIEFVRDCLLDKIENLTYEEN
ncbi:MAG: DUF262 domain-containing protein [Prevotella bivia]|uniref:GmrSD restriction endonucleases N-terminal domain-containing protein n=1 Tax=Prevotella bivia DSM 20514 TaxID=868129 RepID=I4ZAJ7_9BACT|nr:DUF262 domain-containing protein [Prevotella bivia]EFB92652.1 hypothetical protein HMPREF0648_2092 [Prevotella bivia JCVIHMP010]EIM33239.1 Protein of unknown function DUF262 [Prevotella bivia DSM 20514]KGF21090.1 hypothetical protein HMPREF1651_08125 [Prevotella bivia DNF00188]KXU58166.1 hypothetical protein HMPREF3218_0201147 [Prevotella bivia]MDK7763236.1 DUF262 domain-containing protein [Prevotella bivia]